MSPPVPAELPREVLLDGVKVDGIFVPEGTQIGTGCCSLQHNESFFSTAFAYRPGCWIVSETRVARLDMGQEEPESIPGH